MDQSTSLTQNVDALFSNLEGFTQNEGLIGKPVTHGDKTFLPVVSLTLGYGSGNSASKAQQGSSSTISPSMTGSGNMAGGALGLGAKLCTDAVIVIDKDNVSMLQMTGTATGQIMDKIPQIISGMSGKQQQSGQNQTQSQAQNQQQSSTQSQAHQGQSR